MATCKLYALGEKYDCPDTILESVYRTLIDCDEFCHRNKTSAYGTANEHFEQSINEKFCVGSNTDNLEESYTVYEININIIPKETIVNKASKTIKLQSEITKIN